MPDTIAGFDRAVNSSVDGGTNRDFFCGGNWFAMVGRESLHEIAISLLLSIDIDRVFFFRLQQALSLEYFVSAAIQLQRHG